MWTLKAILVLNLTVVAVIVVNLFFDYCQACYLFVAMGYE